MGENDQSQGYKESKEEERNWNYSRQISRFNDAQIVTGVIRNPRNLLWQTWVSLYGNDVVCLTAHRSQQIAEKTIQKFAEAYQAGKLLKPEAVASFIEKMPTDKKPDALSETTSREIGQEINNLFFGLSE